MYQLEHKSPLLESETIARRHSKAYPNAYRYIGEEPLSRNNSNPTAINDLYSDRAPTPN